MRAARPILLFVLVIAASMGPPARAQSDARVMRLAMLVPRGPALVRGIAEWNRDLAARTNGRLSVRVFYGGSMGGEQTMVRRMRIGDIDAASLTSIGLSIIHRPVLVMQAPGLFTRYEQVDRVRREIGPELERGFVRQGFALVGWGDSGRVRLFSRQPLVRPADLRRRRPWIPENDSIFREMLTVSGANGVQLSIGEVFGGLRTGMVDVVPGTALAVMALQWFTSLTHVTAQSDGFLVGGMVVRRGFLDTLSPADREALFASARDNQERFLRTIRRADEQTYRALLHHGLREVDVSAHQGEWQHVAAQARRRLAGRVFPAELLERVERIAQTTQ